jgi:hypothetical protein
MNQQNLNVTAPGFLGLNLEDSPTGLNSNWAAIADNCVIDKSGRVAARKGFDLVTTDNTALGDEKISVIHEGIDTDGTAIVFSAGNNKLFTGTTTLTDITPVAATITADDWQIVTLNGDTFFFQAGHDPIVYDHSAGTCTLVSAHTNYAGSVPEADIALAAYGRLWVANTATNKSTVTWSDLLIGPAWTGGSSGSVDVTNLWPRGYDEIVGLAAHNNFLIIFGKESIIVYGSKAADGRLADPATDLLLVDVIDGIGCVGKHAYQSIGSDLLFVDRSGVRSLGRTIQEKSVPIGDISKNVRTVLKAEIDANSGAVRTVYSGDDAYFLVILEDIPHIYCFDMRGAMEGGAHRVTTWTGASVKGVFHSQDGTVYFGNNNGISIYRNYIDNTTGYRMRYYTHPLTFDTPANLKIPKEIDWVISGGEGQRATCYWGYDYIYSFKSETFLLQSSSIDYYNTAGDEYGDYGEADTDDDPTEYVGRSLGIGRYTVYPTGSGVAMMVGLEATIKENIVSIQQLDIQTLIGRTM